MSVLRKNTLVVDFGVLPKRPDADDIQKFLENKVKLDLADTKNIQFHNIRNCVYIEMIDGETALRYEKVNYNKHTFVCNNKAFKIPVYVESEAVTVRVHDLPSHTHHMTVVEYMQQYGVVISITRERWKHYFPGIYNGVRVLRMKVSRPIPSCVTIDGEKTLVTYRSQPKTCNHCGQAPHPGQKCAKPANNNETPTPTATNEASGPQLDGDEFPPLAVASAGSTTASAQTSNVGLKSVSVNNTAGNRVDNCDDDDQDDDDNDDDDDKDNNNGSSDEFIEAGNRKRLSAKRSTNRTTNEQKKICLSQSSNRYEALVEVESVCPSEEQIDDYLSRSKPKKCNSRK